MLFNHPIARHNHIELASKKLPANANPKKSKPTVIFILNREIFWRGMRSHGKRPLQFRQVFF
jgi:hypothetical protein